jgi:two-component sensor histidine kinase
MALVHQELLESKDLSNLNLKEYIDKLLIHLKDSYNHSMKNISIRKDLADITILMDTVIPLGLVINELFANIMKHAFADNTRGEIKVNLYRSPQDEIVLEISDNGIGFPKDFDIKKDIHFGLETVIALIEEQLEGKIDFLSRNGLHCKITLKKEVYSSRV